MGSGIGIGALLIGLAIIGLVGGAAGGGGNKTDSKKGETKGTKAKPSTVAKNPPNSSARAAEFGDPAKPERYRNFADIELGYGNATLGDGAKGVDVSKSAKGEKWVGQFQGDYNAVSKACQAAAIPCGSFTGIADAAMGRLLVDKDPGKNTLNAMIHARNAAFLSGAFTQNGWQAMVSAARLEGF